MNTRSILAASAFVLGASAQRYTGGWGDFYYPDEEGLQFWRGDTINVTYGCNYTEPALFLVCTTVDLEATETGGYRIDDVFIDLVPPREDYYMVELNQTLSKEDTECWFDMRRNIKDEWGKGDSFASLPFGVWAVSKGEKTRGETTLEPTSTPVETTRTSMAAEATTTANDPAAQTTTGSTGEPTETDNEPNDDGLSTGAQTGIGVGVSIGGLGLIAAGVAFWLLRRRRAKPDGDETAINKNDDDSSRAEGGFVEPKAELDADSQRAELSGDRQAAELDSPKMVKELPGTVTLAEMDSPQTVTELSSPDTAGTVSPESPAYKKPFGAPVELPA